MPPTKSVTVARDHLACGVALLALTCFTLGYAVASLHFASLVARTHREDARNNIELQSERRRIAEAEADREKARLAAEIVSARALAAMSHAPVAAHAYPPSKEARADAEI